MRYLIHFLTLGAIALGSSIYSMKSESLMEEFEKIEKGQATPQEEAQAIFSQLAALVKNNTIGEITRLLQGLRPQEKVALLNLTDNQGNTLLHIAATAGHLDAVKWLVNNGVLLTAKNKQGQTALDVASKLSTTKQPTTYLGYLQQYISTAPSASVYKRIVDYLLSTEAAMKREKGGQNIEEIERKRKEELEKESKLMQEAAEKALKQFGKSTKK
jgi:hypothetical protein